MRRRTERGFSLIEMLLAVSVGTILTVMAVPLATNAMRTYQLSTAVTAASGAIQSTRYAAIMHGYAYEITFTAATKSYQIYNEPGGAPPYVAVGTPIPITSSANITLNRSVTFQFAPGGTVTETSNPPNLSFTISNSPGGVLDSHTVITVSGVGNVTTATFSP